MKTIKPKTPLTFDKLRRAKGSVWVTLTYRFESEVPPITPLKLKVEINTREHWCCLGLDKKVFNVKNDWFSGTTGIIVYQLEELMGTKLRALYQRSKGRDFFDLVAIKKAFRAILKSW